MFLRSRAIRWTIATSAAALTFGLVSCQGQSDAPTASPGGAASPVVTEKVTLSGAGASFPAPLYQRWFSDFNQANPSVTVSYQSVGSGAGVKQFTAGTVDFGASDVAMTDEEIKQVQRGVLMLPMTAGSIVLAYNLPDLKTPLKLSRAAVADIFLGKVKNWNDPAIAKANPDAKLPSSPIGIVYRSDGSGTTGVFTKFLSAISSEWKSKVGDGKTVKWPTGTGAKGNEGITAQVQQNAGSMGYIEYGYAKQNGLTFAALENKAGSYVEPTDASAQATLAAAKLPENMRVFITDPDGKDTYPIVTYSWILAYKTYPDANKVKALKAIVNYGLTEGQKVSPELGYVALPENVVTQVKAAVDTIAVK
ncbi:phosphate ABC transporter substrate-binding protein PstS [Altericista sp. CCNU0014]|uniref:phosphate ABC transporter substrate-binding protein PstS n=1 Tax=Altericista sp. CCNU0014 TaxID=3082949 RepID=UPI00384C6701